MTPTQFQRMQVRYERYKELQGFKQQLESELAKFKEHGQRGLNIEFVGVSCRICLTREVNSRLLPQIEAAYLAAIAECYHDMKAIDVEIGE